MTQLKKALGYTRAASDPGDGRRLGHLSAVPLSGGRLSNLRFTSHSPNGFQRYQLSTSAGYLFGDMRPFDINVPGTASGALCRSEEDRFDADGSQARSLSLSPVWCKGPRSFRRLSVNLDDDFSRLSCSGRSRTSLGNRSSLSKYTPLPAIGSNVPHEEPPDGAGEEGPSAADAEDVLEGSCGSDDTKVYDQETACDDEEEPEQCLEEGDSVEARDGLATDEGSPSNEAEGEEGDENEDRQEESNAEQPSEDPKPPLVRSRTFTVLKVDDAEEDGAAEGDRGLKKGGIAFFIGGADDCGDGQPGEEGSDGDDKQTD